MKRVNDSERLKRFITPCNRVFYEKLAYKPHIIRDIDSPIVDRSVFNCVCDVCGGKVKKKKDWRFVNQSFRADFYCPNCDRNFKLCVRFKQYYDRIDIKRTFSEIVKVDKSQENVKA